MNALTPIQNSSLDTPTLPPPPRALVEWLRRDEPVEQMARTLMRSGRTQALEEALPALRAKAVEESGEAGIMAVVSAAFVHFPQSQRTPEEWTIFWQGYVATCGHLSRAAVTAGMQRWLADPESRFLPKPGELREFSTKAPTDEHQILSRARAVLEAVRAEEDRARVEADHAARGTDKTRQAQAVREMMAGANAELLATVAKQKAAMRRQSIPHANRCVRPEGHLSPAQIDTLARCGAH